MTEPTQEEIEAAKKYNHRKWGGKLMPTINMISASYASHVTAELQAKIVKLEDDTTVLCTSVLWYRDRIATLESELAARDFVPIGAEHRDGDLWLVGTQEPTNFNSCKGRWNTTFEAWFDWEGRIISPTHAAPLPQPPKELKS